MRSDTCKRIHSDNAAELLRLQNDLNKFGIQFTTSSAYILQTNGLAERMNGRLLNKVRAILSKADMNKQFWGDALLQATYLQNRTVNLIFGIKIPQEVLLGNALSSSKIRIFGCPAYRHKHATQITDKLDDQSIPGFYLSSCDGRYRIYSPRSRDILTTKHPSLDKIIFLLAKAIQTDYV